MQVREISKQELHVLNDDGSIIAGVNIGYYRPWIYPLCTPSGINVLREFPPDHGFHNGAFFGHYPLSVGEIKHNFWAAPPFRSAHDTLSTATGRIKASISNVHLQGNIAQIALLCEWIAFDDSLLCTETRSYSIVLGINATEFSTESSFVNNRKDIITFQTTKFSGHAYRLDANFRADLGAKSFLNDMPEGTTNIHGKCASLNSVQIVNSHAQLIFSGSENCFYFFRDYGLFAVNPFMHQDVPLQHNERFKFYSHLKVLSA